MNQDLKETIALNLLTCKSVKEAADRSGCSLSTVNRIRKDKQFQEYLSSLKKKILSDAMKKAEAMSISALQTLREIMEDHDCTDSSRVAAARYIIELGMESHAINDVEDQMKQLQEEIIKLKEGG